MISLEEFILVFAKQFDDTDPEVFTAKTEFHDLDEWSSLVGMCVLAMAKTNFGKSIEGKELKACVTVEDVYDLIKSK